MHQHKLGLDLLGSSSENSSQEHSFDKSSQRCRCFSSSSPLFSETSQWHSVWFTCGSWACRESDVSCTNKNLTLLSWHECLTTTWPATFHFLLTIFERKWKLNAFCKSLFALIRWGWNRAPFWGSQTEWSHSFHQRDWDMREDPKKAEEPWCSGVTWILQ